MTKGCKTSYEERVEIVKYLLNNRITMLKRHKNTRSHISRFTVGHPNMKPMV